MAQYFSYIPAGAAVFLSACTALPPPPAERGISVKQIVDAVQCELQEAVVVARSNGSKVKLEDYVAGIDLNLTVIDSNGANLGFYRDVMLPSNSLSVSAGAALQGQSTLGTQLKFGVDLASLKPVGQCDKDTGLPATRQSLGLSKWLSTAALAIDQRDVASMTQTIYSVIFEVDASGNISPNVRTPGWGSSTSVYGSIFATRKDTHYLAVALEHKAPGGNSSKSAVKDAVERAQRNIKEYSIRQIKTLVVIQ